MTATDKQIKTLTRLLSQAMTLAAEGWELADAYAGGESDTADTLAEKINRLEERINKATE